MKAHHKPSHGQVFFIIVLLVFAAGVASGAVLYMNSVAQHRDLASGKFFTPATQRPGSQPLHLIQATPVEQQNIELVAVESITTTAPAGSQATVTIKQFTGTKVLGTVHYQTGSPDVDFIAAKDTAGNWHVIKSDFKLDGHGPGPYKMVRTGRLTSL